MKDPLKELPIIPGIKDPYGGPLRDITGNVIGDSDPLGKPLSSTPPHPRVSSGLPATPGTIVHNVLGEPVGEIGPTGQTIHPLPWKR